MDSPVASKVEQDFECESLEISEQQLTIGFYPNPTKNIVNFKIIQDVKFTLISQLGQLVLEGNLTGNNKQIDLSHLSASVYYLYIEGQVIKLIKYD